MDEQEIVTTEGAEADGFMDGWEETSPAGEELEDGMETGGDQAGQESAEEEREETEGRIPTPAPPPRNDNGETMDDPQRAADPTGLADTGEGQPQTPRTWTLNHLGQSIAANEADMVTLAQKGLDYDRIRVGYDEARPVMDLFRNFAKRAGKTVPEYLASIREQAKQAEGMSAEEARRAVDLEDREAVVAAQEAVRRQQEEAQRRELVRRQAVEARMQADLREFREVFPEAAKDPASIPREVWEAVRNGRTLVGAYAKYHEAQAAAAQAERASVEERNRQNAALSAGSMRSAGEEAGGKDPFLEGWNE